VGKGLPAQTSKPAGPLLLVQFHKLHVVAWRCVFFFFFLKKYFFLSFCASLFARNTLKKI
jgi:hypothetical protein